MAERECGLDVERSEAVFPEGTTTGSAVGRCPRFDPSTCYGLIDLLLQLPALPGDTAPRGVVKAFLLLERQSPRALSWLRGQFGGENESRLVLVLPELLVARAVEWMPPASSLPGTAAELDTETVARQRLWQVAQLVLRARATERSASAHWQQRSQQQMYNLAYGLSHELNNPLATISARASTLAAAEPDASRKQQLQSIVENAMRGFELLGDLMLVARPPKIEVEPVALAELLSDLVADAQTWCQARGIDLTMEDGWQGTLLLDRSAMREALWGILRNAIEAIGQQGNILLRSIEGDRWTVVEIRDDGPGLSPAALEQCFDCYYSAREAGRGLGLGLAKARRIVELHGGQLTLSNLPTMGCSAIVKLPTTPPDRSSVPSNVEN